jgi:hypothetical protein
MKDNDPGSVFIIHNLDDTVAIKVRSPGDLVFSEVEMPLDAWIKLRNVGGPGTSSDSSPIMQAADKAAPTLLEWHDARKALFDASGTVDAIAAQPYWERLAKAEHTLMDVARGIKSDRPQADWNYTPKPGQLLGPSTKD